MLAAVGDSINLNFTPKWFEHLDAVIFQAADDDGSDPKRLLSGALTGSAYNYDSKEMLLVITPPPEYPCEGAFACSPVLVPEKRVLLPKYLKGERISERQEQGYRPRTVTKIVDARNVAFDDDGAPSYRYVLRYEVKEPRTDLSEEEVTAIIQQG